MEISRDSLSGKLPCPCGDGSHARFSYDNIYSLCRRTDHPTDPNAFPDQVNGVLVTEILTGITSDTAPVDDEPLIIGEPPNPTTSEGDISYSKEGSQLKMATDVELTAPVDPSDFFRHGQPYAYASSSSNEHTSCIQKDSGTGSLTFFSFPFLFLNRAT